ncbi:MAG: hypothetical protein J0L94_14330 [Rhodothermia bacterium]|nr:hypothetical protein [Rhodothermia bacterium]
MGRWLGVDPMAEKYPSWSPYNYVMNNPLGMVDPDGRCPESLKKEGDTYVCPLTLDGGEINAISDKTYRERREYLAGGDYMLEGLGKGFLYMVAGGAGIYAGGAYLAGAGIETAATSFLTHKTVIQGAQIATEIMASEAGLVGVGGAAAVGAKQVAKEAAEEVVVVAAKTSIQAANGIKITGFAKHGLDRVIERGVKPNAILDAIKNPLKTGNVVTDQLGRQSQRFIGQFGEVVVNPQTGKIISVNPTSSSKAAKLLKQLGQ